MKNVSILCLVLGLGVVMAGEFEDTVREIQNRNEGSVFNQNYGGVNKRHKTIDAHFGGTSKEKANDAKMQAFQNRVAMEYDRRQKAHAGYDRGLAKADIAGKHQAAVIGYGESGGSAVAGKQHGNMRFSQDGDGNEHADFTGKGAKEVKTQVERDNRGKLDKFSANGEGLNAKIDPVKSSKTSQEGGLFLKDDKKRTDEFWLYEVDNDNRNEVGALITEQGDGKGSDADQSLLSRLLGQKTQKKYRCKAQKIGESLCVDQNGRTVGKTVATDDGKVVVYNKFNPCGKRTSRENLKNQIQSGR
jgi:hypothetical protein